MKRRVRVPLRELVVFYVHVDQWCEWHCRLCPTTAGATDRHAARVAAMDHLVLEHRARQR